MKGSKSCNQNIWITRFILLASGNQNCAFAIRRKSIVHLILDSKRKNFWSPTIPIEQHEILSFHHKSCSSVTNIFFLFSLRKSCYVLELLLLLPGRNDSNTLTS